MYIFNSDSDSAETLVFVVTSFHSSHLVFLWSQVIKPWDKPVFFAQVVTFSTCADVSLNLLWLFIPTYMFSIDCYMQLRQIWNSPCVLSEHTFMVSVCFRRSRGYYFTEIEIWRLIEERLLSQLITCTWQLMLKVSMIVGLKLQKLSDAIPHYHHETYWSLLSLFTSESGKTIYFAFSGNNPGSMVTICGAGKQTTGAGELPSNLWQLTSQLAQSLT